MARLQLRQLTKTFTPVGRAGSAKAAPAVDQLDLEVRSGELLTVLGPSGCGKTTLLRMIAGLETPTAGEVMIDQADVTSMPARQRDVAMVFQQDALYPHLTVAENIAFGLRARRLPAGESQQRIQAAAADCELDGLMERLPSELSGGQRQRAALARALARRPRLLLMDEPLSDLDAPGRVVLRRMLQRLHQRHGITTVHVTHDQTEAMALGQRMLVMREGRAEQIGAPTELYDRPQTRFVGEFLGSPPMNFLRARWSSGRLQVGTAQRTPLEPLRAPNGAELLVGVRPEAMRIAESNGDEGVPDAWRLPARVVAVECFGFDWVIELQWTGPTPPSDSTATLRTTRRDPPAVGQEVTIEVPDERHWFDLQGQRLDTTD